ncbi:hypothetical protein [Micromonospora sp. HM5-17]|jgi:hypothetical protein|uniref:hypothetical protein n=1 Tax=Micromonospora sp. HM5-17 TaxID=2487710 RepID=UPI000F48B4D7|nr:hypothetical protein [Micromonospora sp. HM5-17]ROT31901.1 hypothetical protein EF879_09620 [Micromonospora sp. HM5-17]
MTVSVGEVVAQLIAVDTRLAAAVVTIGRAQVDADRGHARYKEAGQGGGRSEIQQAIAEARTASEKSAKVARLIDDARRHLANYVNVIAPGAMPADVSRPEAMPDGERLVTETERRARKAEAFLRREIKKAADREDALKQGEEAVTTGVKGLLEMIRDQRGPTQTTTATPRSHSQPVERLQAEHPVTAVVVAIGAGVVGVKGTLNMIRRRRERKLHGDQAGDG